MRNGWQDFSPFLIFYTRLLLIAKVAKKYFFRKKDFSLNFGEFFRSNMSALLQKHRLLNIKIS